MRTHTDLDAMDDEQVVSNSDIVHPQMLMGKDNVRIRQYLD
jgi:hypothetical protein